MRRLGPLLLLLACVAPAAAQEPGAIVRAHVEPAGGVMVGEPARVVIDVLTPTWFLSPPQFPALDVPGALVVFQERGVNLNESIEGTSYSGIQREYLVYPMREGRLSIPPFEVTVVYAIDTRPSMPTPLATQPISFEATVPAAARGLDSFVSALRLDLRQTLEPPPKGLAVGGALRRTVTIEAEGAFGMMLPPLPAPTIAGLSAYPDPPQVEDHGGERGEARVARRVESVAYRLEREGDYELPGIEVAWWDLGTKRMRKAQLPAVAFSVTPAPARADEIPLPPETQAAAATQPELRPRWWSVVLWTGLVPILLALLVWSLPPLARCLRRARTSLSEARLRHLDSEPVWFARVRRAAAGGDAAGAYRALLGWAQRCGPIGFATLGTFVAEAGDADLAEEIGRLEESLYGGGPGGTAWTGTRLVPRLGAARRRALRGRPPSRVGLGPLNPAPGPTCRAGVRRGSAAVAPRGAP